MKREQYEKAVAINTRLSELRKVKDEIEDAPNRLLTYCEKEYYVPCYREVMAYIGDIFDRHDNLPFVNHKDETRTNNCIENLEWCTHEYNCAYGTARERQRKSRAANPKDKAVRRIVGDKLSIAVNMLSPNGAFIKGFKSITEASDSTGIDKGAIIAWCKGKRTKSRKYRFEYYV